MVKLKSKLTKFIESSYNLFLSFLGAFICAFFIRSFIFEPYSIPSGSMKPNFLIGDYLVATKYDYGISNFSFWPFKLNLIKDRYFFKQPNRGDVVIFKHPNTDLIYIKRLIALPGDLVEVRNNYIYVNKERYERKYEGIYEDANEKLKLRKYTEIMPNGISYSTLSLEDKTYLSDMPEKKIPAGYYFMMGDNRDMSNDSRFTLGIIPENYLIGKPKIVILSADCKLWEIWKWLSSIRWERFFFIIS